MALFGSRADRSMEADALEAEIGRLEGLPLPRLAAEVMGKAFGPGSEWEDPEEEVTVGGPNGGAGASVEAIASAMAPDGPSGSMTGPGCGCSGSSPRGCRRSSMRP